MYEYLGGFNSGSGGLVYASIIKDKKMSGFLQNSDRIVDHSIYSILLTRQRRLQTKYE